MIKVPFAFLLLLNAAIVVWYLYRVRRPALYLYPTGYFLIAYVLTYPLRGFKLLFADTSQLAFNPMDVLLALVYSTVFAFVVTLISIWLYERNCRQPLAVAVPTPADWRLLLLFAYLLLEFVYRARLGHFHGALNDDVIYSQPLIEKVFNAFAPLKIFFIGLCIIHWAWRPSLTIKLMLGVMLFTIFVGAVATTSKGQFLSLFAIYIVWAGVMAEKASKLLIAVFISSGILFAFYSYLAREFDYHGTRSEFSLEAISRRIDRVLENRDQYETVAQDASLDRFSYLDALTICIRDGRFIDTGPYALGTVVEVSHLIPRALWPNKPNTNFNHYVAGAVWGAHFRIEMPIGRIAESYFVASWVGILFAVVYGYFYWALYYYLYHRSSSVFVRAIFIFLLFNWVQAEGYMFYNFHTIVLCLIVIGGLALLGGIIRGDEPQFTGEWQHET
jgi:hypothetical protein